MSQWLSLDKLDVVEVDERRFPKLTPAAKAQLRQEPVEFIEYLIRHNLPLRNLVQSDFIVANESVASYYNLGDRTESGMTFGPIKHGQPAPGRSIVPGRESWRGCQTDGSRIRSSAEPGSLAKSSPNRQTIRRPMSPNSPKTTASG